MKKIIVISLTWIFCFLTFVQAQTIFVNHAATGANNGTSWENAYQSLATALAAAHDNMAITEIWVAEGTYYPSTNNNRDDFFSIRRNNLKVYGGFNGSETNLNQRNTASHPTILSGDIGASNNNTDNSYHIMVIELDQENPIPIDNSLLIDGFTFSDGNANSGSVYNSMYPRYTGAAIFISCSFYSMNITPVISNCIFSNNRAYSSGAVSYFGVATDDHTFKLNQCIFQNNYAAFSGAALDIMQLDAAGYGVPGLFAISVEKCHFLNNSVDNASQGTYGGCGAAINTFGQGTLWVNQGLFANNTLGSATNYAGTYKGTAIATRNGGDATIVNTLVYANNNYIPLYNMQSTLKVINSTLYNPNGTVLDVEAPSNTTIQNSILWTDATDANVIGVSGGTATLNISNSIFNANYQGAVTAINSFNDNPLFNNPASGDYSLTASSPGINSGDNALYNVTTMGNEDGMGMARIFGTQIDIGALEYDDNLPVHFGSIAAFIKSNRLYVSWSTITEINNDHFNIELSANGKQFVPIATIKSKATEGNSNSIIEYQFNSDIAGWFTIVNVSALSLLLLFPTPFKRKKIFINSIILFVFVIISCSKKDFKVNEEVEKVYLRIAQTDKDGKKEYSKIIRVIYE